MVSNNSKNDPEIDTIFLDGRDDINSNEKLIRYFSNSGNFLYYSFLNLILFLPYNILDLE